MGKLLEQRNRALDDINAGRTVKKIRDLESRVRELEEENARLKAECDDIKQVQFPRKLEAVAVGWKKRLVAAREECEFQRNAHKQAEELMLEQSNQLAAAQEQLAIRTQEFDAAWRQLAKAEQRVAEACALQVATETKFHWLDAARVAKEIRSGEWRKFVKEV